MSAEALNQGENVDLDALMADLCSIEQELSTVNTKPNSAGSLARLGLTDTKVKTQLLLSFLNLSNDAVFLKNNIFTLDFFPRSVRSLQQDAVADSSQQGAAPAAVAVVGAVITALAEVGAAVGRAAAAVAPERHLLVP